MDRHLLGGLKPAQFLRRHWQKKPLLVRGAFPAFADPLSPDELAGLAMEAFLPSRLVMERGGKKPWELRRGPFDDATLRKLPTSHWTLLVQEVDRVLPEAAAIVDRFDFVPGWRADDLMVSFAPTEGTVGPHVDSYDVFLIQGMGRRRWQIAERYDETLRKGVDLKILKSFVPKQEWILEPGDMLYLPPGVAHHGVALENCMTYSVGFRAPSHAGLLQGLYQLPEGAVRPFETETLYRDAGRKPTTTPGGLDREDLERIREIVSAPLKDDDVLARWFLSHVTRGHAEAPSSAERRPQMAQHKTRDGRLFFYVDGREEEIDPALLTLARYLASTRAPDPERLRALLPPGKKAEVAKKFLSLLRKSGALRGVRLRTVR